MNIPPQSPEINPDIFSNTIEEINNNPQLAKALKKEVEKECTKRVVGIK